LITGASSGIGAVFARQLAARGYDLVLVARRQERLEALAELLQQQYPITVTPFRADLGNPGDLACLETYLASLEDLILLVNNAGFGTLEHFVEAKLNRQLDMIQVNTVAPVRLMYAALPGMISRGRGAIINVSSIAAWAATKGNTIYAGTKSFLNAFSASLQTELQGTGVQIQAAPVLPSPNFTTNLALKILNGTTCPPHSGCPPKLWFEPRSRAWPRDKRWSSPASSTA
jgi:short-subunit dehydrogenase